jgi:hypothetical protein
MKNYVVAVGNAFDGLTLYGPFNDEGEALRFAEDEISAAEWNVVLLNEPAER